MIPLYIDENSMDHDVLRMLRANRIDVVTVEERGTRGRTDEYHLLAASAERRAVYSRDIKDFSRLHAVFMRAGRHHAGIILVPVSRLSVGEEARRLIALCTAKTIEEMRDTIAYLNRRG